MIRMDTLGLVLKLVCIEYTWSRERGTFKALKYTNDNNREILPGREKEAH